MDDTGGVLRVVLVLLVRIGFEGWREWNVCLRFRLGKASATIGTSTVDCNSNNDKCGGWCGCASAMEGMKRPRTHSTMVVVAINRCCCDRFAVAG
jgi:hypothetical protein